MSKFTTRQVMPRMAAPLRTLGRSLPRHEGGRENELDAKTELFLLAVSNLLDEDGSDGWYAHRDERFVRLVRQVTGEDAGWVARLVAYLRGELDLRSAPMAVAAAYDAAAWSAVIPSMDYLATLRNLRNLEEAGVAPAVLDRVAVRLADADEVARSGLLPIRCYSAWAATDSVRFGPALECALHRSLANVPSLPGRTLILVDVSRSMSRPGSARSRVWWWQVAALFGVALGTRAEDADVFAYSDRSCRMRVGRSSSVLRSIPQFMAWPGAGRGARTMDVLTHRYRKHDRVVIVTGEHAFAREADAGRIRAPIFTFDVAGYREGHLPAGAGGRYTFGGLTDAAFRLVPVLEGLPGGTWPF